MIIDNASPFTEFLSSNDVIPVCEPINIIPNVVRDICDGILKIEQVENQNSQFKIKSELLQRYLEVKNENAQRQYHIEMAKLRTQPNLML